MSATCPCGSGKTYENCCELYHKGQPAPTAEALMRSRYCAFVKENISYIEQTMRGQALADYQQGQRQKWGDKDKWQGLEIISSTGGGTKDNTGTVEFKASYKRDGITNVIHEISQFEQDQEQWFYVSREHNEPSIQPAQSDKVSRNSPCPCGSGKKYKKCCGA